jgi:Ca-activated chloride channel family protein
MRGIGNIAWLTLAAFTSLVAVPGSAAAADEVPADKSLSPYFVVENADTGVDALPLKSTDVRVRVLGVIAEVVVTQQYSNTGSVPLEARYVFPASTRAAVHAMNVRLGDRLITADIREKEVARAEYAKAKQEGKTAALLEQHRVNVFQMHVGNILPGDDVRVELAYTELLVPTDGIYRFIYPTLVGPRYNGPPGQESHRPEPWIATPHLKQGIAPDTRFSIVVALESPLPLRSIASPSHHLVVDGDATRKARVTLQPDGEPAEDRDFVLEYRLDSDTIQSGVLLSDGPGEKFFLAMVQPPVTVPATTIVPREYVFIVDVSGSMHGFPLDTTRALINDLLPRLRPSDTFNLLLFSGDNRVLAPQSIPATAENVRLALDALDDEPGGGGTEMLPALRAALAMPSDRDRSRVFVVITDGYVSVERELFDLVRRNLSRANLFAFGIGSSVNRGLIVGLARAGQGEPFVVLEPALAAAEARRFREMIETPVMTNVAVRFEGLDAYDVTPALVPDLFARRPVIVFGKWRGDAQGAVVVSGTTTLGDRETRLVIDANGTSPSAGALRYLWARQRIAELTDEEALTGDEEHRGAIVALGLQYSLLTQHTSFVAVDQVVRVSNPEGTRTVDQPLPLPKGVTNLAVAETSVPGTPEPATWALLVVASLCMACVLRRERRRNEARERGR